MGLQDYTVRLIPAPEALVLVEPLAHTLTDLRFVRLPPTRFVEGAELALAPADEIGFVREEQAFILEALVKVDPGALRYVRSVSVRFALCQPSSVIPAFFTIVDRLAHEYSLNVQTDKITYGLDCLTLFRRDAETEIVQGKERWRAMFEGDTEEVPIHVSEAWAYFLKRHPNLLASR